MPISILRAAFSIALILSISAHATTARAASNKVASGIGHDLAQKFCTSCHLIEPGQSNLPDDVGGPAFQTVANRPETTADTLRKHLKTTHSNAMIPLLSMPNPQLTDDELVKIVAYILSLRPRQ